MEAAEQPVFRDGDTVHILEDVTLAGEYGTIVGQHLTLNGRRTYTVQLDDGRTRIVCFADELRLEDA